MLRKCYKLDTTNYLTQDVNYGIIKVHQGGRDINYIYTPSRRKGAGKLH